MNKTGRASETFLLTRSQAGAALGLSITRVIHLVRSGRLLVAEKVAHGRGVMDLFRRSDVERLARERRAGK